MTQDLAKNEIFPLWDSQKNKEEWAGKDLKTKAMLFVADLFFDREELFHFRCAGDSQMMYSAQQKLVEIWLIERG